MTGDEMTLQEKMVMKTEFITLRVTKKEKKNIKKEIKKLNMSGCGQFFLFLFRKYLKKGGAE